MTTAYPSTAYYPRFIGTLAALSSFLGGLAFGILFKYFSELRRKTKKSVESNFRCSYLRHSKIHLTKCDGVLNLLIFGGVDVSNDYSRPLYENPWTEYFLINVLEINSRDPGFSNIVNKIVSAEIKMDKTKKRSTLFHESYRDHKYRDDFDRKELRELIVKELLTIPRNEEDEDIKLGNGGALPLNGIVKSEYKAYIVIGPPASGKSSISNLISDYIGAVILDSDYAKRKLPEFSQDNGASLVHEESAALIFGDIRVSDQFTELYKICVSMGYNIIIPKIGHDVNSIQKLREKISSDGYELHLVLVSLDRKKATLRALIRFLETGRYVPLSLIFDGYSNDPVLTYYRLRKENTFKSFLKISTDVNKGDKPIIIDKFGDNPLNIFD